MSHQKPGDWVNFPMSSYRHGIFWPAIIAGRLVPNLATYTALMKAYAKALPDGRGGIMYW